MLTPLALIDKVAALVPHRRACIAMIIVTLILIVVMERLTGMSRRIR